MAVSKTGAVLPNGNFNAQLYSTKMIAQYVGNSVVPLVANHDYSGEISKVGDTVNIRKRPSIQIFDGAINGVLQEQSSIADESIQMTIDYYKYFNFPIDDVALFQSDLNYQEQLMDQAQLDLAIAVEQSVLQTIWSSAGSTTTAASLSAANAIGFIMQAGLALDKKLVPEQGRWMIIPEKFKYFLLQSDLRLYINTGATLSPLRTGTVIDQPVGGFKIYFSPYLQSSDTAAKILCGGTDALCFAGQINDVEQVRADNRFADKVRGKIIYGFKVTKPEALHTIDVTSYAAL